MSLRRVSDHQAAADPNAAVRITAQTTPTAAATAEPGPATTHGATPTSTTSTTQPLLSVGRAKHLRRSSGGMWGGMSLPGSPFGSSRGSKRARTRPLHKQTSCLVVVAGKWGEEWQLLPTLLSAGCAAMRRCATAGVADIDACAYSLCKAAAAVFLPDFIRSVHLTSTMCTC